MVDKDEASSTRDCKWRRYWDATEGRPPRPTLLRALDAFDAEFCRGTAVDLGCGTGRDCAELVRRGWHVTAVDAEAEALSELRDRLPQVETVQARLEGYTPPPTDLVNASFSLFFLRPDALAALWRQIDLRPGGRFAGQLLGPHDSWARSGRCTALDRVELHRWLDGWEIEMLEEEETDSVTPRGEAKRWHLWHLVLRRPS